MSPLEQAVIRRKLQHLQELVMLLRAESTTGLADLDELVGQLSDQMAI